MYAVVLPVSLRLLWPSVMMAFARAMGETMAVMMVVGNANLFPELLGKGETIASLIALEMGTAAAGSTHMHALFAAGFVLLAIVLAVDAVTAWAQHRLARRASRGVRGGRWVLGRAGACLARGWAWAGMAVVAGCIVFCSRMCSAKEPAAFRGSSSRKARRALSWGTEGGIFPAIVGSAWFTATALVIAVPLALALAVYRVFFVPQACRGARRGARHIRGGRRSVHRHGPVRLRRVGARRRPWPLRAGRRRGACAHDHPVHRGARGKRPCARCLPSW